MLAGEMAAVDGGIYWSGGEYWNFVGGVCGEALECHGDELARDVFDWGGAGGSCVFDSVVCPGVREVEGGGEQGNEAVAGSFHAAVVEIHGDGDCVRLGGVDRDVGIDTMD